MKVCFDTNVVIDILGRTNDFIHSFAALDVSLLRGFSMFIPITSTTDIAYLLPRRGFASGQQVRQLLSQLFSIVEILDARAVDANKALSSPMPDYEDALLTQMALRNGIDLIVTRNVKDFDNSPVTAISPEQFVLLYKPKNVEYSWVDEQTN
jgi:predicted nucleic acid-binding protein